MKYVFFAALLVTSLAQAQMSPPPVESLDQGACWVSQIEPEVWRVASFNDTTAFQIDANRLQYEFEPALTRELKNLGLSEMAATKYETHIHCSGAGHIIIMNFKDAATPLCVLTNSTLDKMTVNINPLKQEGACGGAAQQTVIIKALDAIHAKTLADILSGERFKEMVGDIELMPAIGAVTVKLNTSWRFREGQAMAKFRADSELALHIDDLMYSHVWTVVGQSMHLLGREYPGYKAPERGN